MMLRARSSWCAVTRVLAATTMLTTLELDNWAHDTNPSGTKESAGDTRDADDMFREKLISRYDVRVPASTKIMCMVTGISFNPRNVIAGHIISVKNRARAMTILRMHAMDERNGIIWCTAIEKAWSHNQLCFIRPPGAVPMPLPLVSNLRSKTSRPKHIHHTEAPRAGPHIYPHEGGSNTFKS